MENPKGLKGLLITYLKGKEGWVHKGEIQKLIWKNPRNGTEYIPDNVGTCLRWLERNHYIAVKPDDNNKSVMYKYLPAHPREFRKNYVPTSDRARGKERITHWPPLPWTDSGKRYLAEQEQKNDISEAEINDYMNHG